MSSSHKNNNGIERIELSEAHKKPRLVLIGILIVIAAVSLTTGVVSLIRGNPGWRSIEAAGSELNCGTDFVFQYYLDAHQLAENRKVTALYSQAAEKGYWLFTPDQSRDSEVNVCWLNRHVNQPAQVDPVLYEAFAKMEKSGLRNLYLAPVYMEYDNLFASESDEQAANRDPLKNPEMMAYFRQITAFINDPAHVQVELLPDSRVQLKVSPEYLRFAEENGIEEFIDFHWMKNAFIIDYMAELMEENGFTRGYLASVDGFTRNLDDSGAHYSYNLFDRVDNAVYLAGRMDYTKPLSIVTMRSFPINRQGRWRYYVYADGTAVAPYADPADGVSKAAVQELSCYGEDMGCTEILFQMIPAYAAEEWRPEALPEQGIGSIWCRDQVIRYNDGDLVLYDLHRDDRLEYSAEKTE